MRIGSAREAAGNFFSGLHSYTTLGSMIDVSRIRGRLMAMHVAVVVMVGRRRLMGG